MGKAYAFRRKIGAPMPRGGSAGHVGWGFALPHGKGFTCGATENPRALPWLAAGDDNGAWIETVDSEVELVAQMRSRGYDDYKFHETLLGNVERASIVAENCMVVGYSFAGNNCLDHAYQVLVQYGVLDLPLPLELGYPNPWFDALRWESRIIEQ